MSAGGASQARVSTILHADLDAFYASVEQRDDPELAGRPVAVGGGMVLAVSYEARRFGVTAPLNEREARRRCPHLVVVPPRMHAYTDASRAVFDVFRHTSPMIEAMSIDEAFLDVTGLWRLVGSARQVAADLRNRVREEVGLPLSVGVASTKFLAKVASAVSKPDGLLVVEPGRELEFLHPLPVEALWGVGPKTAQRLHDRGLTTVADVACLPVDQLVNLVGKGAGRHLHSLANNRDPRSVEVGRRNRSIGSQRSFPDGDRPRDEVEAMLLEITDRVAARLRASNQVARTVTLRLRFGDFRSATRSTTLHQATASTAEIQRAGTGLLTTVWPVIAQRGLTKVGLALSNLSSDDAVQLALPLDGHDRSRLDAAIDQARDRFGYQALARARLVGSGADPHPWHQTPGSRSHL